MPADAPGKIDFSSFLTPVNAAVGAAAPLMFFLRGRNDYADALTALLAVAFAFQNHFFLVSLRKRHDPFLLLLVVNSVFFYGLRAATLLWAPWSAVLARNPFTAGDLNSGLLYVMLGNSAIFFAALAQPERDDAAPLVPPSGVPARLFVPLLLVLAGLLMDQAPVLSGRLRGYLCILLNSEVMLLFLLVLAVLYAGALSGRQRLLLLAVFAGFVALRTAAGSRSAALTLFYFLLCAWLAVRGRPSFGRGFYAGLMAAIPAGAVLFVAGTLARDKIMVSFPAIFERIGSLDMAAEGMANSFNYGKFFNFPHYFKSVVDNALSPGFTVFDAPKAANLPVFFYRFVPEPTLRSVAAMYQSDMVTVYGEARIIFGAAAGLAWIFFTAFLFQKLYRFLDSRDPFRLGALRAALLYIFLVYFLGSYGLDWFAVDMLRGAVPFLLLLYAFSYSASPGRTE